ncbi:endonuclease toxin domain-containing protein, partial [Kitasatospora sp. NPDC004240]
LTGRNGGAGAFVDKYVPVRPAYAMYVAAAKLREFGCNNVADEVEKDADNLAAQVAIGAIDIWARRNLPKKNGPNVQNLGKVTEIIEHSLWKLSSNDKGLEFEKKMGMDNLPAGSLTWDHFEPDSGIAISLKSMDTTLKTINNPGAFYTRLKGVVDDAATYSGDKRPSYKGGVNPDWIKHRVVYVITNSTVPLTEIQIAQMTRAVEYAQTKGVVLLFGGSEG